jgi:hypothetical protein
VSDALYYLVSIVAMALIFVWLKRRSQQAADAREPERRADAARFGWQFETDHGAVFEVLRWRGTTTDVPWVAEALRTGRSRHSPNVSGTRVIRWSTRRPVPVRCVIAMLHGDGMKEFTMPDADEAGGTVMKALLGGVIGKAFEIGFGDLARDVDAKSLVAVDALSAKHPGYTVLTTDRDAAQAFFFQRLDRLLDKGREPSLNLQTQALSVLITPEGVALQQKEWTASPETLQPIVNTGVALAIAIGTSP